MVAIALDARARLGPDAAERREHPGELGQALGDPLQTVSVEGVEKPIQRLDQHAERHLPLQLRAAPGKHRVPAPAARERNSESSRVLPIPGSPEIASTRDPPFSRSSRTCSPRASSCSRPIRLVVAVSTFIAPVLACSPPTLLPGRDREPRKTRVLTPTAPARRDADSEADARTDPRPCPQPLVRAPHPRGGSRAGGPRRWPCACPRVDAAGGAGGAREHLRRAGQLQRRRPQRRLDDGRQLEQGHGSDGRRNRLHPSRRRDDHDRGKRQSRSQADTPSSPLFTVASNATLTITEKASSPSEELRPVILPP